MIEFHAKEPIRSVFHLGVRMALLEARGHQMPIPTFDNLFDIYDWSAGYGAGVHMLREALRSTA